MLLIVDIDIVAFVTVVVVVAAGVVVSTMLLNFLIMLFLSFN